MAAAKELGKTPVEIALAWVIGRPQVTSVLVGATKKEQLELNLSALALELPPEIERRLTQLSRLESTELDDFFDQPLSCAVGRVAHVEGGAHLAGYDITRARLCRNLPDGSDQPWCRASQAFYARNPFGGA